MVQQEAWSLLERVAVTVVVVTALLASVATTSTDSSAGDSDGDGGGTCLDFGASCEDDPLVVEYTNQCDSPGIGPCHCAAAATAQCFLNRGCYQEAMGLPPCDGSTQECTDLTEADLEEVRTRECATAADTNTTCSPPC